MLIKILQIIILFIINIIVKIINKWKNKNKMTFIEFEHGSFCTKVLKWRKN